MRYLIGAGLVALAAATPAAAQSGEGIKPSLSVTTGVDYSVGDYGLPDDTKIFVAPISARLTTGKLELTASVPYIRLDGAGGVVLGPDGKPLPGVPGEAGTKSGFGDISLGASISYELFFGGEMDLGGRVKLPTSKDGLSTGERDYVASADFSYPIGKVVPFVNVGYRIFGDPEGTDLKNGPTISAGSSFDLGKATLIASYDWSRAVTEGAEDSKEIFAGLSVPAGDRLSLTGYGTAGLSKGSADYGVGLLLTAKVF
jgi:hypothetical protein